MKKYLFVLLGIGLITSANAINNIKLDALLVHNPYPANVRVMTAFIPAGSDSSAYQFKGISPTAIEQAANYTGAMAFAEQQKLGDFYLFNRNFNTGETSNVGKCFSIFMTNKHFALPEEYNGQFEQNALLRARSGNFNIALFRTSPYPAACHHILVSANPEETSALNLTNDNNNLLVTSYINFQ